MNEFEQLNNLQSKRKRVTTIDNPFDPFKDFVSWFLFDTEKGYFTCSKLARIANTTNHMTEKEQEEAIEYAMNRLVELDPLDVYVIVEEK